MELPEEFKEFMKYKYFHYRSGCKNPSAFASMYYIMGYEGRYGVVRAACEDELRKIASDEGKRLKELKQNENNRS
jgi:hypothetical protein